MKDRERASRTLQRRRSLRSPAPDAPRSACWAGGGEEGAHAARTGPLWNRAGLNALRSTLVDSPVTSSSAMARPVAGAQRMPHELANTKQCQVTCSGGSMQA